MLLRSFFFFLIGLTALPLSLIGEGTDISLSHNPPSGYVLQRGILQLEAYGNYADVDMGEALGADVSGANGVGRYSEQGGRIWFGLTDHTTASLFFGLTDFSYQNKTAEIGYQEFRLKRSIAVNHPTWGFWSLEGKWFRHSMNELKIGPVVQTKSNDLHDYGYGLQLQFTKPLHPTFDLHGHVGYANALEDGNQGQSQFEGGFGLSKYWAQRYRVDLYGEFRQVDRHKNINLEESNMSIHVALTRQFSPNWAAHLRAQYNDTLFVGIWPFLDREMSNISLSKYGYVSLGFTYRTRY